MKGGYSIIFQGRKHWSVYIIPSFMCLLGLAFLTIPSDGWRFLGGGLLLIGGGKILSAASVRWTLTEEFLYIKKGVLPWTKTELTVPVSYIYECFAQFGMLGHLLGFGNLVVRRTEGVTTQITETSIAHAKQLAGHINQLVFDRTQKPPLHSQPLQGSPSEELERLGQLRGKGELTSDEYEKLKKHIMDRID